MSDSFLRRTWVEVDLDAIASNFREVKQKAPGAKIMAVVKADAYGHGVEQVSRALAQAGADWFGVSNTRTITLPLCPTRRLSPALRWTFI